MQSFTSKELVKEIFSWRVYYWYLTNEGIEYLREYLNLSADVVPNTLKKSNRPATQPMRDERPQRGGDRPGGRPGGDSVWAQNRRCDRNRSWKKKKKKKKREEEDEPEESEEAAAATRAAPLVPTTPSSLNSLSGGWQNLPTESRLR